MQTGEYVTTPLHTATVSLGPRDGPREITANGETFTRYGLHGDARTVMGARIGSDIMTMRAREIGLCRWLTDDLDHSWRSIEALWLHD